MTFITNKGSTFLVLFLKISKNEALTIFGNIFLGGMEASLLIKPYLPTLTKSELALILAGGFSSVSGGILGAYFNLEIEESHILTSCLMSPFATVAILKIVYPDKKQSQNNQKTKDVFERYFQILIIKKIVKKKTLFMQFQKALLLLLVLLHVL